MLEPCVSFDIILEEIFEQIFSPITLSLIGIALERDPRKRGSGAQTADGNIVGYIECKQCKDAYLLK